MSGLFGTLNTANKGLMASQTAMQTTGHNVTNSNTRGYTRQRVNFQADKAFNHVGVGQIGTGVRMTSITRTSNEFINRQVWNEISSLDRYGVKSDIMGQLEGIFNEPSNTGINNDLNQVFDAWSELAKNPESTTSKTVVSEKMKALTDNINHMYGQMSDLKKDTEGQLEQGVRDINANLEKLDKLNEQIFYVSIRGQEPNDLLDQRDVLIEDLNKNVSVDVEFDEFGRVKIDLKGDELRQVEDKSNLDVGEDDVSGEEETKKGELRNTLLDFGQQKGKLKYDDTSGSPEIHLTDTKGGNIAVDIKDEKTKIDLSTTGAIESGSFKGNYEGVKEVEKKMQELKKFASGISQAFNKIHGAEIDDNKDVIKNLFTETKGDSNRIIEFNPDLYKNPEKIISGIELEGADGDGARASAIKDLSKLNFGLKEDGKIDFEVKIDKEDGKISISSEIKGNTISGQYADIITGLGITKQQSDNIVDNQELLVHQLEARRQSEAGVSLNEEVTDMIKFQGAYQANARVIQTIADMLDTLINRTGFNR